MKKYLIISLILSVISFFLVLFIWQNYQLYTELRQDIRAYLTATVNSEEIDSSLPEKIIANLEKIQEKTKKIHYKNIEQFQPVFDDLLIVVKKLLREDQNYIVLLQNSDELRATGGFIGSFFMLESKNGQIVSPKIQDIYAVDGQFTGLLQAPSGLDEYLSSGKGMRLPDANWWPNFPDSAKQVLYFFETTRHKNYQGVIAVNLNLLENLLDLTGEIYLPDYDQTVDKNNFANIARADRVNFFPGSQEKVNFLNHFLKMFKLKLIEIIEKEPDKFIPLLQTALQNKDLQFYSRESELASIFSKRQIAGEMRNPAQGLYYFLVESNVGINKANKLVDRQVTIDVGVDEHQREKITIDFQNNNPFPYVNYQRLYTNSQTQLENVKIDGQEISKIDQHQMKIADGEQWLEIGFLVSVLGKSHGRVEIELYSELETKARENIFIQKQAGLRATNYTVNYLQDGQLQNRSFILDKDLQL